MITPSWKCWQKHVSVSILSCIFVMNILIDRFRWARFFKHSNESRNLLILCAAITNLTKQCAWAAVGQHLRVDGWATDAAAETAPASYIEGTTSHVGWWRTSVGTPFFDVNVRSISPFRLYGDIRVKSSVSRIFQPYSMDSVTGRLYFASGSTFFLSFKYLNG